MLSPHIREAVDTGKFGIYPVEHITEALELLTAFPPGSPSRTAGSPVVPFTISSIAVCRSSATAPSTRIRSR